MTFRIKKARVRDLGLGLALVAAISLPSRPAAGPPSVPPMSHPPTETPVIHVVPPNSPDSSAYHSLASAIAAAHLGAVIELGPGTYDLTPQAYSEPTCGN